MFNFYDFCPSKLPQIFSVRCAEVLPFAILAYHGYFDLGIKLHDIVEDGVNGVIISGRNEKKFAYELKSLMFDDARREEMAQAGKESCKKFLPSSIVNKWEELFSFL